MSYDGTLLDPALVSRFLRLQVEADVDSWLGWAAEHDVHPAVMDFVGACPDVFRNPAANPRAFTYCSDLIKSLEASGEVDDDVLMTCLAGWLPLELAMALGHAYSGSLTSIEPEQVLTDYDTWRPLLRRLIRAGSLDAVHATYAGIRRRLRSSRLAAEILEDRGRRRNLRKFLGDLPADLKRDAADMLAERGIDLTVPRRRLK
jgi:hypothetical protein